MMAVKKFDYTKGYRLISYAVWWIRAQIRSFIVKSWSLVKMGTTYAQRKLFFSRRALGTTDAAGSTEASHENLAKDLGIETREVDEIELRMAARDFSLDSKLGEDSRTSHLEVLADPSQPSQEMALIEEEQRGLLLSKVDEAMSRLNDKERYIVENRLLQDEPRTLQDIGEHFKVSRERVRQLESRVIGKLRAALERANQDPASEAATS